MTFNNTDPDSNGVSIQNNSQLTFEYDGVYNIQFSAQLDRVAGPASANEVDIWFSKNGISIPDTNTVVVVAGITTASKEVAAWNLQLKLNAGDYIELYWSCPNINVELTYIGSDINPTRPAVPSVILSAQQVMYTQTGASGLTGATGPQGPAGINESANDWNSNTSVVIGITEQLVFSGDYVLEDSNMLIEASENCGNFLLRSVAAELYLFNLGNL
jgi:hypothetical protein